MGFFDRLKQGLKRTRDSLTGRIEQLILGYADIDDEFLDELQDALIMADVGLSTTEKLMEGVRLGIKKREVNTPAELLPYLQKEISELLSLTESKLCEAKEGPTVILAVGVNV